MHERYRGEPPPLPQKKMEVFCVKSPVKEFYVCYSRVVFGQSVHWHGRRSHECNEAKGTRCEGCIDNWPKKWKGYLHVGDRTQDWEGFLELTATAWSMMEAQLRDRETMRGVQFWISRTKGGPKGRYVIELLDRTVDDTVLKEERDPLQTLRALWRAKKGPSTGS